MAGVEREQDLAADGVADIELGGARRVALGANAEQLPLDRVQVVFLVNLLLEHRVQRRSQALARPSAVGGRVLHAVGNPKGW